MVATLVYKNGAVFSSKKFAFDPEAATRLTNFETIDGSAGSLGGANFPYSASLVLNLPDGAVPYFLNLKMLFNDTSHPIGVKTINRGFSQGTCYESRGTVPESGITRVLAECRTWPVTPEIFNYLLYSQTDIFKK